MKRSKFESKFTTLGRQQLSTKASNLFMNCNRNQLKMLVDVVCKQGGTDLLDEICNKGDEIGVIVKSKSNNLSNWTDPPRFLFESVFGYLTVMDLLVGVEIIS